MCDHPCEKGHHGSPSKNAFSVVYMKMPLFTWTVTYVYNTNFLKYIPFYLILIKFLHNTQWFPFTKRKYITFLYVKTITKQN